MIGSGYLAKFNSGRFNNINLRLNLRDLGLCYILVFLYRSLKPYFIFLE